jgi:hypothetical protein
MGLLDFFSGKKNAPAPERLPSGSFTVDRDGKVLTSTLPSAFPTERLRELGQLVVEAMHSGRDANLPVTELVIHFSGLKVTAKEQRGGAMIFLAPLH